MKTTAYGSLSPTAQIQKIEIDRRELNDTDVAVTVTYCGICHSDIHTAKGDWGEVAYPCVPGHEVVGTVTEVGSKVTSHKPGDTVGVGCMVNSCKDCNKCRSGNENYCDNVIWTYASTDRDGTGTKGGYSEHIVVDQDFVIPIPEGMNEAEAAPLLCAGITMYSPLKHWRASPGKKVSIIGIGGLGHMGLKIAKAMGAEVTAITTNPNKADSAKLYGADKVLVSTDDTQMKSNAAYFDLIIDTAPGKHDLDQYINLLGFNGVIVLVGPIATQLEFEASNTLTNRRSIAGSGIGSIGETKEMLAFCKQHNIYPKVDII
jgi:alcohol dehydrogenase (NADP+)